MRATWVLGTVAVLGMVTGGCGDGDDTVAGDEPAAEPPGGADRGSGADLAGRTFLSASVTEDGQAKELVAGTQVQLTFHDDGRMTANAGCNTMGGTPTVTADRIEVGDGLAVTEMGCDPALHDQDQWLADLLGAGPAYALDGDRLTLTAGTTTVELVDREVADPDRPLEGTTWTLDGLVDGGVASSVPAGVAATVTFDAGTVTVDGTGCNGGSGRYTLDEAAGQVTVSALAWTRMACGEPSATVEAALGEVLDGAVAYEVEAATLTLSHPGGKGLTLRAG